MLAERVAFVGVEAGGDADEVGGEFFQILEGARGGGAPFEARGARRDGVVVAVVETLRAGAGIGGVLVNGEKRAAGLILEDGFGAVAVMHIEVEHGDFFHTGGAGGEHGGGDGIEIAEAHRAVAGRVVSGRTQEAEVGFAFAREGEGVQRAADGAAGVGVDAVVGGRVAVEEGRGRDAFDVIGEMRAEQRLVGDGEGFEPGDGQIFLRAEMREGVRDAGGALGVAGLRIGEAAFVGDDVHGECGD